MNNKANKTTYKVGHETSGEIRKKISESLKRIGHRPPSNKGRKLSEEHKRKIMLASTGKICKEETKQKISLANKGKIVPQERREKIRKTLLGRKTPLEVRKKQSIALSKLKERHWAWKGGISMRNNNLRRTLEYRLWREAIFERDKWTCKDCGAKSAKGKHVFLNADHILPFAYFPHLRFTKENGRTLCADCHKRTDTYGEKVNVWYKNEMNKLKSICLQS